MIGASKINFISKFTSTAVAEIIRRKVGLAAVGNAQVSTTQSKFGGSSALFDGTGDYLTTGASSVTSDLALTGNYWTVEYWARINAHAGAYQATVAVWDAVSPNGSVYYFSTNGYNGTNKMAMEYVYGTNSTSGAVVFGSALSTGVWQHHAFVRNGNTLTAYLDGVSQGTHDMTGRTIDITGYNSSSNTTMALTIGAMTGASGAYNGHLDEIRISNTARYTTGFTPSTTPFVNDDNTLLLIHANGTNGSTFLEDDNGVRAQKGLVAIGNTTVNVTAAKFGSGSILFDGSGDYLKVEPGTFALTSDFTIEFWIYLNTKADQIFVNYYNGGTYIGHISLEANNGYGFLAYAAPSGGWVLNASNNGLNYTSTNIEQWYHLALVRNSNTFTFYVDGVSRESSTSVPNLTQDTFTIGAQVGGTAGTNGYMQEFRISNVARYTSNFTAPSAPFVNDTNTLLLIHGNGDNSQTVFLDDNGTGRASRSVRPIGTVNTSTAQSKFGGSSALFDGASDRLFLGSILNPSYEYALGTSNFTLEMWIRSSSLAALNALFDFRTDSGDTQAPFLYVSTDGRLAFTSSPTGTVQSSAGIITTNTWYHVAMVRNSGTTTLYNNGTSVASTSTAMNWTTARTAVVGLQVSTATSMNGYIDELRLSNIARYTGNFTAPTQQFQNDDNTILLLHMDGTNGARIFFDDNGRTTTP